MHTYEIRYRVKGIPGIQVKTYTASSETNARRLLFAEYATVEVQISNVRRID
ncbi:MAG: hypothetical protein IJS60_03060 [Abditibacteriota bacterium]|nr:hypothetical protein [Abditibacteriota bacterium]